MLDRCIALKTRQVRAVVAHAFNPSTWERQVDLCEFEASLVYRVSSRMDRQGCYTEKPCLEKANKTKQKWTKVLIT